MKRNKKYPVHHQLRDANDHVIYAAAASSTVEYAHIATEAMKNAEARWNGAKLELSVEDESGATHIRRYWVNLELIEVRTDKEKPDTERGYCHAP